MQFVATASDFFVKMEIIHYGQIWYGWIHYSIPVNITTTTVASHQTP